MACYFRTVNFSLRTVEPRNPSKKKPKTLDISKSFSWKQEIIPSVDNGMQFTDRKHFLTNRQELYGPYELYGP